MIKFACFKKSTVADKMYKNTIDQILKISDGDKVTLVGGKSSDMPKTLNKKEFLKIMSI